MRKPRFQQFDPGTGLSSSDKQSRIMEKDGSFNIIHRNRQLHIGMMYSYLINASWSRFFVLITLGYIGFNILFAFGYLSIGVEGLGVVKEDVFSDYLHCFFFSTQTFTTIGYGFLAPKTAGISTLAALEGFIGLLYFASASGLFYGRISRPKPQLRFSSNILIRDFNDTTALMFRMMNKNRNVLMNLNVTGNVAFKNDKDGKTFYTYNQVSFLINHINMMPYTWTIVHVLDENSPFNGYTKEELSRLDAEILIMISYFDDTFSQEMYQRHSYTFTELLIDRVFVPAFEFDENGNGILDHEKLDDTVVVIPETSTLNQ